MLKNVSPSQKELKKVHVPEPIRNFIVLQIQLQFLIHYYTCKLAWEAFFFTTSAKPEKTDYYLYLITFSFKSST